LEQLEARSGVRAHAVTAHEQHAADALVARAQQGDADAFGALYDRYQPDILRYLLHHVRDRETAEDLTQHVFLRAWQAIPRYQQRSVPFSAWLYRMARNRMIDHFRTRRPTVDIALLDFPEPAESEARVLAAERRVLLERGLARLSPNHREVLVLRFVLEHSAAEIGAIMGRKEVTVRGLQLRALRALRKELAALEPSP